MCTQAGEVCWNVAKQTRPKYQVRCFHIHKQISQDISKLIRFPFSYTIPELFAGNNGIGTGTGMVGIPAE